MGKEQWGYRSGEVWMLEKSQELRPERGGAGPFRF